MKQSQLQSLVAEKARQNGVSTTVDLYGILRDQLDPTHRDYTGWLAHLYLGDKLPRNDFKTAQAYLKRFHELSERIPSKLRKVTKYDSLQELYEKVIQPYDREPIFLNKLESYFSTRIQVRQIYAGNEGILSSPTTEEGARHLARGTAWAIAGDSEINAFYEYNQLGPIYVVSLLSGESFFLHFATQQYLDQQGEELSQEDLETLEWLSRFPEIRNHAKRAKANWI